MMNVKLFEKVGFIMFLLLFFLISCSDAIKDEEPSITVNENPHILFMPPTEGDVRMAEELESEGRLYGGIGMGVTNITREEIEAYIAGEDIVDGYEPGKEVVDFSTLHIADLEEQEPLYMQISGMSNSNHIYTIRLFLNYEPIAFQVLGEEGYAEQFDFMISSGYSAFVPFVLNSNQLAEDASYKLTAAVFVDHHIHAADWEGREDFTFLTEFYGDFAPWWSPPSMVLNYDLTVGEGGVESFDFLESEIDERIELPQEIGPELFVMWATESMRPGIESNDAYLLERRIEANPGEELRFSAWVLPSSPFDNVLIDDYLFISLLNSEPVPMNEQPFLYVNLEDNMIVGPFADRIDFTITAPLNPGNYEFVSFIIHNPTGSSLINEAPREVTPRVTIVVSE